MKSHALLWWPFLDIYVVCTHLTFVCVYFYVLCGLICLLFFLWFCWMGFWILVITHTQQKYFKQNEKFHSSIFKYLNEAINSIEFPEITKPFVVESWKTVGWQDHYFDGGKLTLVLNDVGAQVFVTHKIVRKIL